MSERDLDADIIVSGAGPSGLTVASEAALGGARVLVLEKRNGPTWSRAGTLAPRVMELFDSRGIADAVLKRAHEIHADPLSRQGIWAGLPPLHYKEIDSDYNYFVMFAQIETERMLAEHFRSLGGDLRLNSTVLDFTQDEESVSVRYRDASGAERSVRGRYLIGADGNKSVVRQAAGIAFTGKPAERIAVNVDAILSNPYKTILTVANNAAGWAMTYPIRDGVTRFAIIDAATMHEAVEKPLDIESAKAMLRRVHGTDYGITEVDAINRFHDALFLAEKLRDRRVFLVGESVRVHYPASGVGMNFCIQDAFNLGWKLALTVRGLGADWLLDTFESERLPDIHALLNDVRRQCAIQFNFDDEHVALKRFIENDLLPIPQVNRRLCENLAGLSTRYVPDADAHDIVGRRLPNLAVTKGAGVGESFFALLRRQQFVLLDLTGKAALPHANKDLPVVVASADPGGRESLAGVASVLVRPDGYVSWASDKALNKYTPEAEARAWFRLDDSVRVFEQSAESPQQGQRGRPVARARS